MQSYKKLTLVDNYPKCILQSQSKTTQSSQRFYDKPLPFFSGKKLSLLLYDIA